MHGRRPAVLRPIALAALASVLGAQGVQPLDGWIQEAEALGARTGCVVLDRGSGTVLFAHRATEAFAPASNQKLLTAVAALAGLGPDYAFETRFALVQGVLRVRAGGDPCWVTGGKHDPAAIFAAVAARLHAAQAHAVRDVVLDLEPFVGPSRPASWPQDQLGQAYCAPAAGLALDQGCYRARLSPGRDGKATIEVLAPPLWMPVEGSIRLTADRGAGSRHGLHEAAGKLHARGALWSRASPKTVEGAVDDPPLLFARALRSALDRGDIAIDARAPVRDLELLTYRTPLRDALLPMLAESSNFHAEQVLRVLGAETLGDGSLEGGRRAVRAQLERLLGEVPPDLVIADGSGLSAENRTTPWLLVAALHAGLGGPGGALLLQSLPEPGGHGTLRGRFRDSPVKSEVRAKTGWISGVSALSGAVGGRAFSILMRYERGRSGLNQRLKELQERMVEAIAGNGA